jgi:hypothetical protein
METFARRAAVAAGLALTGGWLHDGFYRVARGVADNCIDGARASADGELAIDVSMLEGVPGLAHVDDIVSDADVVQAILLDGFPSQEACRELYVGSRESFRLKFISGRHARRDPEDEEKEPPGGEADSFASQFLRVGVSGGSKSWADAQDPVSSGDLKEVIVLAEASEAVSLENAFKLHATRAQQAAQKAKALFREERALERLKARLSVKRTTRNGRVVSRRAKGLVNPDEIDYSFDVRDEPDEDQRADDEEFDFFVSKNIKRLERLENLDDFSVWRDESRREELLRETEEMEQIIDRYFEDREYRGFKGF